MCYKDKSIRFCTWIVYLNPSRITIEKHRCDYYRNIWSFDFCASCYFSPHINFLSIYNIFLFLCALKIRVILGTVHKVTFAERCIVMETHYFYPLFFLKSFIVMVETDKGSKVLHFLWFSKQNIHILFVVFLTNCLLIVSIPCGPIRV